MSNLTADDLRVLVVAPSGRDAELICRVLRNAEITCEACSDVQEAVAQLAHPTGAMILAEEALNPALVQSFKELTCKQPAWSDFPLVLLTFPGMVSLSTHKRSELREPLGNILLLERPIRPETLISTVKIALRTRMRQYQVRDQLEKQKLAEGALRQSEKLAVAGRLAASIAHEINNPLEAVTNLLYLIQTSNSMPDIKKYADMASEELARVSDIASHTLRFHRQSTSPTSIKVSEVLDSVLSLYRQRLKSCGISVERQYEDILPVVALSGELRQVFANLIANSIDAMRFGGTLKLRVKNASELLNGRRRGVRVLIADTGTGISPQAKRRLFEPFFSTKGTTGTGLGLWVSSSIIQKHSGTVRVRSSTSGSSSGTVFSIFLPDEYPRIELLKFDAEENIA
ncbi:MAG: histidine kinase [Candidatus Angelobacter sp.]|jgi:signal transduction histidine kinase|nr:histidine kinase [Candidatus Angelobacter sp.]